MRFSQRFGYKPIKNIVQTDSIDDDLRNCLWSALKIFYWDSLKGSYGVSGIWLHHEQNKAMKYLCDSLWVYYYKRPLDNLSNDWEKIYERLRKDYFSCSWFEVYDFIEYVAENYPRQPVNEKFVNACNNILEREVSAYRFVSGRISKIVDDTEIQSIEETEKTRVSPVKKHIRRAVELLVDRKSPDYRNSIKESISAVEAMARVVTDSESGTLGDLLKKIETNNALHPALKTAFSKLYGYTSDKSGIRHSLLEEDDISFEEAKFMLVVCSAFINYVTGILNY